MYFLNSETLICYYRCKRQSQLLSRCRRVTAGATGQKTKEWLRPKKKVATLSASYTWERLSCRIDLTSHLCLEQLIENLAFTASDGRSSTFRICFELFLFATVVQMFTFFFVKCAGEIRYLSHGFLCYSTLSTCIPDSDKLQNWKELTFPFFRWKYAYTAICEEKIRCWTWARIKEHRYVIEDSRIHCICRVLLSRGFSVYFLLFISTTFSWEDVQLMWRNFKAAFKCITISSL